MALDDINYNDPVDGNLKIRTDLVAGKNIEFIKVMDGRVDGTEGAPVDLATGMWVNVKRLEPELLTALGYGQLTSLATEKELSTVVVNGTPGIPAGAKYARIQPEVKDVRYRCDDGAPTAGLGMLLAAGDSDLLALVDLTKVHIIEVAGSGSAKVNVEFFG